MKMNSNELISKLQMRHFNQQWLKLKQITILVKKRAEKRKQLERQLNENTIKMNKLKTQ